MADKKYTKAIPVQSLVRRIQTGKLVLQPDFQRESVWTTFQKQLLIDSLLRDLDIPKIYIRLLDNDRGEVVDGQQRLTAMLEFLTDVFKLRSDADDVKGIPVAGRHYSELPEELKDDLTSTNLDVVHLTSAFSDTEVEDMFLRLQQGTPLNAAEKRRALPGTMKSVVADLAKEKIFALCTGLPNKRFAHEDAVAKIIHQRLKGEITDIRPNSLESTYKNNSTINADHPEIRAIKSAFSFLVKAFPGPYNPSFKKFSIISITFLTTEMLKHYDLRQYPIEFGNAYKEFESKRTANDELPDSQQDPKWLEYSNAARSDSISAMEYRVNFLQRHIHTEMPYLVPKDPKRAFTVNERTAIYLRDKGRCQGDGCGKECSLEEFEADHITPHSEGGKTVVQNGQVLCIDCHRAKTSG